MQEKIKEVEALHKRINEFENDTQDSKLLKKRAAEVINQMKKIEAHRENLEKELSASQNQVTVS